MKQPDLGTMITTAAAMAAIAVSTPLQVLLLALVAVVRPLAFGADYRVPHESSTLRRPAGWRMAGDPGLHALANGASPVPSGRAPRWFYLPTPTDFIFAIIGEETGFVGGLTIIAFIVMPSR